MKIKRIVISAAFILAGLTISAQERSEAKDLAPKKGDITMALSVGYNSYTGISAKSGLLASYEAKAMSTNWTDKKLMVGFESGWFVSDLWKLDLGGGLNFTNNPGYSEVPGTADPSLTPEENMGEIPSYRAVADAYSFTYMVFAGIDRYFETATPNLVWYSGLRLGFAYGLNQQKYDEYETMGKSTAETWNLRAALTVGVDYFIFPSMYVGASIDPFAYTYNMTSYKPQDGLANLSADSHNYGMMAAPTVKLGFKF